MNARNIGLLILGVVIGTAVAMTILGQLYFVNGILIAATAGGAILIRSPAN